MSEKPGNVNPNDDLPRRLRATRAAFHLKQGEFGAKAGLAANTYNQFEQGTKRPSIENAISLCETYSITLDWIYRGEKSGMPYALMLRIQEHLS